GDRPGQRARLPARCRPGDDPAVRRRPARARAGREPALAAAGQWPRRHRRPGAAQGARHLGRERGGRPAAVARPGPTGLRVREARARGALVRAPGRHGLAVRFGQRGGAVVERAAPGLRRVPGRQLHHRSRVRPGRGLRRQRRCRPARGGLGPARRRRRGQRVRLRGRRPPVEPRRRLRGGHVALDRPGRARLHPPRPVRPGPGLPEDRGFPGRRNARRARAVHLHPHLPDPLRMPIMSKPNQHRGLTVCVLFAAIAQVLWPSAGQAQNLPSGVVSTVTSNGSTGPTVDTSGTTMTVTLDAPRTIINWDSFDVGAGYTFQVNGLSASDILLNRVLGGTGSNIDGLVQSNANVWIFNPSGIAVGATGRFDVGGLMLSTSGVADADFLDGDLDFYLSGSSTDGITVAQGAQLSADTGGLYLLAPYVSMAGSMESPGTNAVL